MSMKRIAEAAGVSISTVSLVLSGKGRISEQVRARVLGAAKALSYKSPLYSEQQGAVVVLYSIDREWEHVLGFMNRIICGLEQELTANSIPVLLLPISFTDKPEVIAAKLRNIAPRAVCSIHYSSYELFSELEASGIPVVIVNRSLLQDKFCTVCVDDFQGAYEAGKTLLNWTGNGRVVFVGYAKGVMTNLIDDRLYGFQKALLESGCSASESRVYYASEPLAAGMEEVVVKILETRDPQGVFVYDDYLALHLYAALQARGKVEGVRILAPGDTLDYSLPIIPQISTMSIDTNMLGVYGGRMIVALLRGGELPLRVQKVRQNLVIRGT